MLAIDASLGCGWGKRVAERLTKGGLVSQWNIDESVVGKGAHACNSSALLATTEGAGADEHAGVLAPERALGPLLAGLVPESRELGWEVSVTGGDAEQDTIKGLELGGVVEDRVAGLGWSVHLCENIVCEGLGDSVVGLELVCVALIRH
jgi:hypothetical protein